MTMQSIRILAFRIHTWIGLNTCILLSIMFLTGTLLVFSTEVENAFYAKTKSGELPLGQPLTFGQVFDNVQAAYPDARIATVVRSDAGGMFGDRLQISTKWGEKALIWSDPGTGEILGATPVDGVRHMLLSFHDSLFTGQGIGQAAVSLLAFSLLVSIISGLIAYRRFWRALKTAPPRGRGSRPWWGGLHRFLAVWTLPFLLAVAVSGIYYFVVVLGVIPTEGAVIPAASERQEALPHGFNGAMLDRAVAAASAVAPGQAITAVVLPFNRKQGISFYGPEGGSLVNFDTTQVVVDPKTATVLTTIEPADFSPKNQAKHFFDALHHGDWAGNYSRAAWLFFGAMGTLLMFSGAMVYASRIARMPKTGSITPACGSAPRRIWRGMAIAKWALIPAIILISGIGIYRFGLKEEKWVTIPQANSQILPARLQVKGPFHAGEMVRFRLIIEQSSIATASVSWTGDEAQQITLTSSGGKSIGQFQRRVNQTVNTATVQIASKEVGPVSIFWKLGKPVF